MTAEPCFSSATDLSREIQLGRITASALLERFLERIDRLNPTLNAIVVEEREAARRRAAEADAAQARGASWGPLHGVPMTIKESHDRRGLATTWGDPARLGNVPSEDALAVQRLERAGAIVLGKTNVAQGLADFQTVNEIFGRTHNPWDVTRTAGGSSGGSSAALAAGLTALELGSDIAGSIRNPAHFCGVFGHKPTWNLLPPRGHALGALRATDIAVIGPLARSARDLELVVRLLGAPDELEAAGLSVKLEGLTRPLSALRVAVWDDDPVAPVAAEVAARVRRVAAHLADAGAVVDATARPDFDARASHDAFLELLWVALGGAVPDDVFAQRLARVAALDRDGPAEQKPGARTLRAQVMSHRHWMQLDEARTRLRWAWHHFFQRFDVVLMPVFPTAAFPHDARSFGQRTVAVDGHERPYFEGIFWAGLPGVAYLPSTVIPTGPDAQGLPIGVQIVGPAYADLRTIQLAVLLEDQGFGFVAPPLA